MKPKITIEIIPYSLYSYFQWFLLGLLQLEKKGKIEVKFSFSVNNFLVKNTTRYLNALIKKIPDTIQSRILNTEYTLKGKIVTTDGRIKTFILDCADSPFLFNINELLNIDYYFKMQCPKEIGDQGFPLSSKVSIPFDPIVIKNKHKVYPAMVGPRLLSKKMDLTSLEKGYNNYYKSASGKKQKKLMCYFGDSKGPIPFKGKINNPDFNDEQILVKWFEGKSNHPNEKRGIAANLIREMGPNYDARVINEGNCDTGGSQRNNKLYIPLNQFCEHVSKFEYNLNISGYRNSIPNRFIESFMVGTAILTDSLNVKWYKPFDEEVVETTEMSYLLNKDVNWHKFKEDVKNLPETDSSVILKNFHEKWAPDVFANYIIKTISR